MNWPLAILSWIVAAYFGIGFLSKAGIPPKSDLLIGDALFVGLFLFFSFLPFFNKIKIGSWLELEREIKEARKEAAAVKEEVREFKNEVRNTMNVVSSNSIRQSINVHLPGSQALKEQGKEVDKNLGADAKQKAGEVETELQAEQDVNYALAKVRIDIERLLRIITRAVFKMPDTNRSTKFLTIPKMFEQLVKDDQSYEYLGEPIKYVLSVCNAAIHAQYVTDGQASEALQLGAKVIAALKQHPAVKH